MNSELYVVCWPAASGRPLYCMDPPRAQFYCWTRFLNSANKMSHGDAKHVVKNLGRSIYTSRSQPHIMTVEEALVKTMEFEITS